MPARGGWGLRMGAAAHILALTAVNPVPVRSQMGSSLGFHIILACFGIAFAAVVMTAEWIGIRRGDAAAMLLARRWSKVMAGLGGGDPRRGSSITPAPPRAGEHTARNPSPDHLLCPLLLVKKKKKH